MNEGKSGPSEDDKSDSSSLSIIRENVIIHYRAFSICPLRVLVRCVVKVPDHFCFLLADKNP